MVLSCKKFNVPLILLVLMSIGHCDYLTYNYYYLLAITYLLLIVINFIKLNINYYKINIVTYTNLISLQYIFNSATALTKINYSILLSIGTKFTTTSIYAGHTIIT